MGSGSIKILLKPIGLGLELLGAEGLFLCTTGPFVQQKKARVAAFEGLLIPVSQTIFYVLPEDPETL